MQNSSEILFFYIEHYIKFYRDSQSHLRWSCVCWHPEIATQLALSSEDDQNPVVQIWDLRFATSPLKVSYHIIRYLTIFWKMI